MDPRGTVVFAGSTFEERPYRPRSYLGRPQYHNRALLTQLLMILRQHQLPVPGAGEGEPQTLPFFSEEMRQSRVDGYGGPAPKADIRMCLCRSPDDPRHFRHVDFVVALSMAVYVAEARSPQRLC